MNDFGLSTKEINIVRDILKKYPSIVKVVVFGSRATNTYKVASDIDLAVWFDGNSNHQVISNLLSDFDDSILPYFVDVIDYCGVSSDALRKNIDRDGKMLYRRGWEEVRLGDVGKVITGRTPSKDSKGQWGDVLDFVTPTDYTDSKYIGNTARKLSVIGIDIFDKIIIPPNNILVSCIGSDMGKVMINRNLCITNQQINALVVYEDFSVDFFYYLLKYHYPLLRSLAFGGSTMPILNKSTFENIKINIPSIDSQKKIANILSSLDDKIELLREQNKTLEAIAQTIFKEWFIDFNFPDDNGNPYKDSGGEMIDSEMGLIPRGWRVGVITEIIKREVITYKCTQIDIEYQGKIPIIDQGSTGLYGYTSRNPDFIATKDNPVIVFTNHTCNYWFVDYSFCAIQNVIPYRGAKGYDEYFIYFLTKDSVKFIEYKGHWADFVNKNFIIPRTCLASEFSRLIRPMLWQISENNMSMNNLVMVRNLILPKLMNGDIILKKAN